MPVFADNAQYRQHVTSVSPIRIFLFFIKHFFAQGKKCACRGSQNAQKKNVFPQKNRQKGKKCTSESKKF